MFESMSQNTPSLKIATLNIMDARRTRLNAALRCMSQMNVDLGILTETKLSHDKYAKMAFGYAVVATKASATQGGVALFYRKAKGWSLESTRTFGPNVIRTTLVSGQKRWYIIGAYIPPSEEDGSTLECITQARNTVGNHRWPVVVLGDLNVDFENLRENRGEGAERRVETAALMGSLGLRSIRGHFCQRKGLLGRYWTWRQRRQGVLYGSICDHILTDKRNSFLNCQIKTPRSIPITECLSAPCGCNRNDTIEDMLVAAQCSQSHHSVLWKETGPTAFWRIFRSMLGVRSRLTGDIRPGSLRKLGD